MNANGELSAPSGQVLKLLDCERRVLELIGSGAPLNEVLLTIVNLVEQLAPEMRCAILLADGTRLDFAAGSSIPEDFKACMKPFLQVGPGMAQCGRSAFWREPIYTEDTAVDPRWMACRDVAVRNELRAIWSTPVLSDDGVVLGTFTMFHRKPGMPGREHVQLIDMAVQLARVAVESKHQEERLRASELESRDVIDNIPVIAWTTRPDGPGEYTNRSWEEYTGQNAQEAKGWGWAAVLHPHDRERHLANWHRAVDSGGPFESEARYRRRDGAYRWFLARGVPRRDERGTVQGWYGILVDIQDRKRAEAAVRENEQLLKFVLETLSISVVVMDAAGNVLLDNAATRRLWGGETIVSGAERWGYVKGFWHRSGKQLSPNEWASASAIAQGREVLNDLIDIEAYDGTRKTIENSAAPIRNSDGAIMGAVVINHEVSDRVRAEEALRESAHHLQRLSRQLMDVQEDERRHLARELHDRLGATLTALSINLVALQGRTATDREAQARVDDSTRLVKSTALAMENLVADLRPPMLDEHGLAAALRWYGRQFAERVGVAVTMQPIAPGLHLTPEARIALFRIAQEALNNVAKHAHAKRVSISLRPTDSEFVMSISDDGVGLPTDEGSQHSGLGMTSMRERAQAVGGRFEIERLAEGGTRLTVTVPR